MKYFIIDQNDAIMKKEINLYKASVYVGTYHKYNNGSLAGEWLNLINYDSPEEFYQACRELHKDEDDPEFMFQDHEYLPDNLIGECWISEKFFEIRDTLEEEESEPFLIWCANHSHDLRISEIAELIEKFREDYTGEHDSMEDYARQLVEECYDLSEFALRYFDYEAFAKDLFCGDYWTEDGHVFRNS